MSTNPDTVIIQRQDEVVFEDAEIVMVSPTEQGPRGVPGMSAYAVWLSLGGVGTPDEFMTALRGDQGDQGAQGVQGPPLEPYEFIQNTPQDVWLINHQLNRLPSVIVVDSTGEEVEGGVVYDSRDHITITFSAAFSGKAFLN